MFRAFRVSGFWGFLAFTVKGLGSPTLAKFAAPPPTQQQMFPIADENEDEKRLGGLALKS